MSAALRLADCQNDASERVWAIVSGYPAAERYGRILVILQACIDDSGSGEPPVMVLAGFESSVERWAEFSDAWKAALMEKPSIRYFKMKEAASGYGEFKGLSFPERDAKVRGLVEIIKAHTITGIGCSIILSDYKAVFSKRISRTMDNPYFLAFYGIQSLFHRMQNGAKDNRPVDFIFDEQGKQVGQALSAWKYWREKMPPSAFPNVGNRPISQDDQIFLPLQAADLVAWRVRREVVDASLGKIHPIMPISEIACVVDTWDKPRLKKMFDRVQTMKSEIGGTFPYDSPGRRG